MDDSCPCVFWPEPLSAPPPAGACCLPAAPWWSPVKVGPAQCRAAPQVLNSCLRAKGCSAVGKERQAPASIGADTGAVVRLAGMGAREAPGKAGCRFTWYELGLPHAFPGGRACVEPCALLGMGEGFGWCSCSFCLVSPFLGLCCLCAVSRPYAPARVSSQTGSHLGSKRAPSALCWLCLSSTPGGAGPSLTAFPKCLLRSPTRGLGSGMKVLSLQAVIARDP